MTVALAAAGASDGGGCFLDQSQMEQAGVVNYVAAAKSSEAPRRRIFLSDACAIQLVRGKLALSDWPLQLVVVASSQVTGAGDRLRPRRWRKQML